MNALREKLIDQFGTVACSGAGLYPADIPNVLSPAGAIQRGGAIDELP